MQPNLPASTYAPLPVEQTPPSKDIKATLYKQRQVEEEQSSLSHQLHIKSEPEWMSSLKLSMVRHAIPANQHLVRVSDSEYVYMLLSRMRKAGVSCALVIDSTNPSVVYGFIDQLDLLIYVISVADLTTPSTATFRNVHWEGQCFALENALQLTNMSQWNPCYSVFPETTLSEVLSAFAQGLHRVAVKDPLTQLVTGVFTQGDLLRFMNMRGLTAMPAFKQSISTAGLHQLGVMKKTWLAQDTLALIDVFKHMKEKKVSGVPVVDKEGRIITNFSATDLLLLEEDTFPNITLPVLDFLRSVNGALKPPVTCTVDDTVENIILKMIARDVHRVYIVNSDFQPIGVITMTDVCRYLMKPTEI